MGAGGGLGEGGEVGGQRGRGKGCWGMEGSFQNDKGTMRMRRWLHHWLICRCSGTI